MDNSNVSYGYLIGAKNFDVPKHRQNDRFLPFVVLTHVNDGKGFFEYEGKKYTVDKGETMFVPECVLHNVVSTEYQNVSWAHVTVNGFKYNLLGKLRKPEIIKGKSSIAIRDYINILVDLDYMSPSDYFKRDNCISGIFLQILDYFKDPLDLYKKSQWVLNLENYITLHIKENFNLDELAKNLLISKSSLCHKFKNEMGISLINFILQEKIKASLYMLNDGLTNSQIAENLSLCDEYYFSKLFKKIVGLSPKDYKKTIY